MMLLIVTAALLVGISSIIYQPTNVQAQQTPLGTGGRPLMTQKQAESTNVQAQQTPLPGTKVPVTQKQFESTAQAMADKQLLDRLFPQIIKRIDGATLLQKIDAKLLVQKMLPYIQVKLKMGQEYGPLVTVKKSGITPVSFHTAEARCPVGTRVMGGGGQILPHGIYREFQGNPLNMGGYSVQPPISALSSANMGDNNLVSLNIIPTNRLSVVTKMVESGTILAHATCLNGDAEVSLKP